MVIAIKNTILLIQHGFINGKLTLYNISKSTDIINHFGLVSLFNGISTFVGYLMPKPFSKKNSSGTI